MPVGAAEALGDADVDAEGVAEAPGDADATAVAPDDAAGAGDAVPATPEQPDISAATVTNVATHFVIACRIVMPGIPPRPQLLG
jgi:hypothetical protein